MAEASDAANREAAAGPLCGAAKRVAVVASLTKSLVIFRLQLMQQMVAVGHEVTAFGPEADIESIETLRLHGIRFVCLPMNRTGTNPLQDFQTFLFLLKQFKTLRPDIVLPYTMKPIIYGLLAARLANVRSRYALVTGLGHVFSGERQKLQGSALRALSVILYRAALAGTKSVFVYNDADKEDLNRFRIVRRGTEIKEVAGSGVDLHHFAYSKPLLGFPRFLLVARLLRDKGIHDYVHAARLLRKKYPGFHVDIVGPFDPGPNSLSEREIYAWVKEGVVVYHGETSDVRPFFSRTSVVVLPSYYREGIPRSLLEALAVGRAIITTDMPGCRDTVLPGENGFLVQPRDAEAIAAAMEAFIRDESLALSMGRRSREIAVAKFDVHSVNKLLLSEMHLL